jgi:hypothetical protein
MLAIAAGSGSTAGAGGGPYGNHPYPESVTTTSGGMIYADDAIYVCRFLGS